MPYTQMYFTFIALCSIALCAFLSAVGMFFGMVRSCANTNEGGLRVLEARVSMKDTVALR